VVQAAITLQLVGTGTAWVHKGGRYTWSHWGPPQSDAQGTPHSSEGHIPRSWTHSWCRTVC